MGKIALNMIVRNAGATIRAALESTKGAVDVYVIGFAGRSSDLTRETALEWLEENEVEYIVEEFDFVDFSDARNRVLDLTPKDAEWLVWMDSDDTILGADELRGVVEACEKQDVGVIQFPYIYHRDKFGNPLVIHDRERVVRLDLGWRWFRPVHETLNTSQHHQIVRLNNLTWIHQHEASEGTRNKRNLALLLKYVEDNPDDVRTFSYLAHAYFSDENHVKAIEWFQQAYDQPTNDLEKWQSAVFLGRCWFNLDEYENAIGWAWQAIDVEPRIADPYLLLGACYTMLGEYDKAYEFYLMANDKRQPPSLLFVLPNEYTFNRWAYEHRAAAGIGRIDQAIEICQKALKHSPNHGGFIYYLEGYEEAVRIAKSKEALKHLVHHLQMRGDALTAVELLRSTPKNMLDEDDIQELITDTQRRVEHLFNDQAFEAMYGSEVDIEKTNMPGEWVSDYPVLKEPRFRAVADIVERHQAQAAKRGERLTVVDLGCGDGMFTIELARMGCLVTGIDSIPANVERAQQMAEKAGVGKRTRFICSQIERIELNEIGKHDLAVCLEVIEHVQNPGMILGTGLDLAEAVVFSTPHQQVGRELANTPDGVHLHHVREFHFMDLVRMAASCGGRMENLTTAYAPPENTLLPGYGSWIGEIVKTRKEKAAVVFYTGGALEKWTPESLNEGGIGGSETAVIQMAKLFSRAGHLVFVFGPSDGVWDGVVYRNYKRFVSSRPAMGNPCLLFVSSRVPEVFDNPPNAVMSALWLHDWDYGYPTPTGRLERLTKERAEQIDVVFVLSDAQRKHFEKTYPFLKGRLTVTANGIDPGRFADMEEERQSHRFVWSSSPDRGLDRVLRMWPSVRKMWEDAELHVFYGFKYLDARYVRNDPQRRVQVEAVLQQMEQLPGVTYHGRVSQDELAKEFARSQFWFYPTSFTETYCIGAIEAQAAGCTPVSSAVAALADKVPARFRLSDKKPDAAFLRLLERVDNGQVAPLTDEEVKTARTTTWERVFEQWEKLIDKTFEAKKAEREEKDGNHIRNSKDKARKDDGRRGRKRRRAKR